MGPLKIEELLRSAAEAGASDLHLKAARPPLARINGRLHSMGEEKLSPETVRTLLMSLLDDQQKAKLEKQHYLDFAYSLTGVSRFRSTIFRQRGSFSGVFRRVPFEFPSLDDWNLPEVMKEFITAQQGLILVTGPTGSGKSSTLAALVNEIVVNRAVHVVTIEDPIEFLISDCNGMVSQREIGTDTLSFSHALRNTLRQDPDIIMVGEMRDIETIGTVLDAAETGHLVLSTLHTNSASQSIDRIVSTFPQANHRQIRQQLAQVIVAVVSLQLAERADGSGMVAAVEILRGAPQTRKLISDGSLPELHEEIERSVAYENMQSMNQSLVALYVNGVIDRAEAMKHSPNAADLDLTLRKLLSATGNMGDMPGMPGMEEDMAVSKADFSHILRLQEVQKAYEDLQERFQREVSDRDERITSLETMVRQVQSVDTQAKTVVDGLAQEKERLEQQVAFQRQEYESKIEKLQNRIRELNTSSAGEPASRSGLFRR